jgi:hypothetical protein
MLLVSPATLLFGPVFGYNLIIYLSHLLSGLVVFLWVKRLTGNSFGGTIAGLIFILAPFRVAHSYGHLQLVSTQTLPLFFWTLDEVLRQKLPSPPRLLALAGATALVGSMSQYYLVMAALIGSVYALFAVSSTPFWLLRNGWKLALSVGAGAVLCTVPYLAAAGGSVYSPYDVRETRVWSASPLDFVVPSRLHPLWGDLVERSYRTSSWIEYVCYPGVAAVLLALFALLRRRNMHARRTAIWSGALIVAAILALGTDLHLGDQPVQPANPFWLPMYYLGQLPVVNLMRGWSRFSVVVSLFVALLAGLGAAQLLERCVRGRRLVVAVCLVVVSLDLLPGRLAVSELKPRPIDRWLAAQPGSFAVAFLPSTPITFDAMYGSLIHGKQLPATNHTVHQPHAFRDFVRRAADFPSRDAVLALRALGLRYLVLNHDLFDGQGGRPDWRTVEASLRDTVEVRVVAELDAFTVVEFSPMPEPSLRAEDPW